MTEEGPLWRPGSQLPEGYTRTSTLISKAPPIPAASPPCYFCRNTLTEETFCTCSVRPEKHCRPCHTLLEQKGWLTLPADDIWRASAQETRRQLQLFSGMAV